jgi:hypothetical protein
MDPMGSNGGSLGALCYVTSDITGSFSLSNYLGGVGGLGRARKKLRVDWLEFHRTCSEEVLQK